MRGRLAGQLAFTAGEDALLARALLRFGPDLERARLYLLPARARAELEHRVRTRAHARAGDNGIKARPPLGARPRVGTWLGCAAEGRSAWVARRCLSASRVLYRRSALVRMLAMGRGPASSGDLPCPLLLRTVY